MDTERRELCSDVTTRWWCKGGDIVREGDSRVVVECRRIGVAVVFLFCLLSNAGIVLSIPIDKGILSASQRALERMKHEPCTQIIEQLQNDVVWYTRSPVSSVLASSQHDQDHDTPDPDMREAKGTTEEERNLEDESESKKTVDFRFRSTSPFVKFNSKQVVDLLRGHRFLFVGNSMMNRLTQSLVIMMRCCPDEPPVPSNDQRHWYDQRTYHTSFGHGSYYYDVPCDGKPFDLTRSFGNGSNYLTQGLLDFSIQPIANCPETKISSMLTSTDGSVDVVEETRYSIDCDFGHSKKNASSSHEDRPPLSENVVLAFKYTNTPVLNVERWLLEKLRTRPVPPDVSYRAAQNDITVMVVQSPDHDEDYITLVDDISKVMAFDEERGLGSKKRWFIYGRTYRSYRGESESDFRENRHIANERTVMRSRIASSAGIYYVPLYKKELVGVREFGVAHEDFNHWHFKDVGQHFVTQVFLNSLQASMRCEDFKKSSTK